jgi:signal transduction histidine kinase/ligand-binding sensor domain-containing protein/CheY-like chemotaxis protein/AraC-like DNA-binding protein
MNETEKIASAWVSAFLFILLWPALLSGQEKNLFFRHLTTNEGLSHNSVYAINEDDYGFMWIGTRSGLNRFDGYSFKIYDNNNSGLRNAYINTIFKDSKGRMWIGTQEGGLSRYNTETDNFTTYTHSPGSPGSFDQDNIQAIAEDSKGSIWAGTHGEDLYRLEEKTGKLILFNLQAKVPAGFNIERINTIFFESDTLLWLGTLGGLYHYNQVSGKVYPEYSDNGFVNDRVLSLFNENQSIIWLGTSSGVVRFNKKTHQAEKITTSNSSLSNDQILDIERIPDGRIMIATDGGGLNIYDPVTRSITQCMSDPNNPYTISNNSVYEIFTDKNKGLWVGNYVGGINYYSEFDWKFLPVKHQLNDRESLSDNHIRTFFQDREGGIWIGTLGGLNHYNPNTGKFKSFTFSKTTSNSLSSNTVLAIYEDREGNLWIGTFGGGISIFDKKKNTFRKFSHPDDNTGSLEKASIYAISETNSNKLCITSLGGIYILDRNTGRLKRYTSGTSNLSNNTVKVLCNDKQGNIWLGTNHGLNRFNPETEDFLVYTHSNSDSTTLANNRILSILQANDGRIWVGTEGGGVSILNPGTGKFYSITSREGLPDNVVNAIVQDNNENLWISTNKGLVQYDPVKGKLKIYTVADGLQGNEFNQKASLKTSDGKIYFGGSNGFNAFYPGNLVINTHPPKVLFTDLYISNKLVSVGEANGPLDKQLFLLEKLTLDFAQSNFEIHFSALGFINIGKYKYSFFMKGVDEAWTDFREVRSANYASLRPGLYTFMVKALNNDGVSSIEPAVLQIRILPPWWKTWWAYTIYAIIIISSLILFIRVNTSWVKVKQQLLLERFEKDQLEELNQMKLGFFTNISHEFKTPLTLILGHLDNLKNAGSEKKAENISNIEKNARRLLFLINQLLEFRKAESGLMKLKASKGNIVQLLEGIKESFNDLAVKKNIQFELTSEGIIPEIWFDAEKMEKIIFNLLSNAFKYTEEGGSISIQIRLKDTKWNNSNNNRLNSVEISIRDTGIGIAPDDIRMVFDRFYQETKSGTINKKIDSSGIGLAYCKRLVDLHHGDISAESELGKGSSFLVILPIGKDHLSDEEIKEEVNFLLKMDYQGFSGEIADIPSSDTGAVSPDDKMPLLLVVDDNPQVCIVIAEKFRTTFRVITAANGNGGLEIARQYLPDIIISDIMMPGMDGIEFCQKLKEDILTSHIPVILLTAKSGDENQIIGIKTGADAYLSKPYNPDLLQVTIENLINNRKLLRNKFAGQPTFVPAEVVSNKLDEQFLVRIISLIENDSDSDTLDVTKLSREVAMSRSVLYRKLKALTGNSIQDFVRIVKLRKAARMLLDSDFPVSEIAYQSGFANSKHFSTAFKRQFGKTPSEYRINA